MVEIAIKVYIFSFFFSYESTLVFCAWLCIWSQFTKCFFGHPKNTKKSFRHGKTNVFLVEDNTKLFACYSVSDLFSQSSLYFRAISFLSISKVSCINCIHWFLSNKYLSAASRFEHIAPFNTTELRCFKVLDMNEAFLWISNLNSLLETKHFVFFRSI